MFSPAVAKTLRFVAGIPDEDQPDLQEPRPYTPAPSVSTYNDPTDMGTQATPVNYPSSNATSVDPTISDPNYVSPSSNTPPSITIADGRTEPPTPQGDWQPVETVPAPSQVPYGPPLSEAGPEPVSPYDAEQPWRPTLQIGRPPQGPNTPPAAPNAALDAPVPYGPPLSEAGPEGPRQEPTTWYGRAGQAALDYVIAPALEAMDTANEWLINSPVGNVMPQAMGRELAGSDQISREVREDQQRLEALIRRFRAGDTSVEAEIQALTANLNTRTGGGRAGLLAAGERNPDKGAETAGQVASAALTFGIAPGAGSGVVRNVVAGAMDPVGQGIGLAADAAAPVVRGARAAGRAALQTGGDAPVPSSLGSGMVPEGGAQTPRQVWESRIAQDLGVRPLEEPITAPYTDSTGRTITNPKNAEWRVEAGPNGVPEMVQTRRNFFNNAEEVPGTRQPLDAVYRVVSREDYEQAVRRGYMQSDGRLNLANDEGTVTSAFAPSPFYNPKNTDAVAVRIRMDPADGWRLGSDGYVKTNKPIPMDRVEATLRYSTDEMGRAVRYEDAPQRAGSGFVPRGADLRNAAQGGVIGAASELTSDEELTPQERLARMTIGGGLAVMAGRRAGGGAVQRAGSGMVPSATGRSLTTPTTELVYQGRIFAVEATGDAAAPFKLKGARGADLTLVPHGAENGRRYYVQRPNGKTDAGFVGQMSDGSLLWLPSSGPQAPAAQRAWRADLAAQRAAERTSANLGSGFVPAEDDASRAAIRAAARRGGSAADELASAAPGARQGGLPGFDDIDPLTDVPRAVADADRVNVPQEPIGKALPGLIEMLTERTRAPKIKVKNVPEQPGLPTLTESPNVMRRVADALAPWGNRINVIRYAGMLSDTATQTMNAGGGVMLQGLDLAAKPISATMDAARSAVTGKPREVFFSEIPAQVAGMRAGASVGLQNAWSIIKTGARESDADKLGHTTSGFGTDIEGVAPAGSKAAGVIDFAFEGPLRALAAADAVFRSMATGGHLMAEAEAAARKLAGGKSVTPEMVREAAKDPALLERVKELAARAVLQEDRALTAWYARAVKNAPAPIRAAVSVEIPFVKTPYNIVAQGMGMTPAGLATTIYDVSQGKAARHVEHQLARVALGTAIMGVAAADYASGNLTGPRPTDQAEASTLPPGWQPWSRKVKNPVTGETQYVPLGLAGPLAVPAVTVILAAEAHKKGKTALSPEWAGQVALGIGRYAEQSTFFEGIANLSKMFDERTGEANIARNVESIAAQFSPHIIGGGGVGKEIQRITGMPMRDPEGALEALLATHPMTADRVLPRQDVLGRPVVQGGGAASAIVRAPVERDMAVIRAFRKAGEGLPIAPPKQVRDESAGTLKTLTPSQRKRWQRAFGSALREGWDNAGNPADAKSLQTVESRARTVANQTVLGQR